MYLYDTKDRQQLHWSVTYPKGVTERSMMMVERVYVMCVGFVQI